MIDASLQNPDLPYPLRREVKRDRIVINSKALREAINYATEKALKDYEHSLFVFLQNEVNPLIERSAYSLLTSILTLGSTNSNITQDPSFKLGATFGVALGNAISDIAEDIIFGGKNR